jgi:uracil-DNA glycosylase
MRAIVLMLFLAGCMTPGEVRQTAPIYQATISAPPGEAAACLATHLDNQTWTTRNRVIVFPGQDAAEVIGDNDAGTAHVVSLRRVNGRTSVTAHRAVLPLIGDAAEEFRGPIEACR